MVHKANSRKHLLQCLSRSSSTLGMRWFYPRGAVTVVPVHLALNLLFTSMVAKIDPFLSYCCSHLPPRHGNTDVAKHAEPGLQAWPGLYLYTMRAELGLSGRQVFEDWYNKERSPLCLSLCKLAFTSHEAFSTADHSRFSGIEDLAHDAATVWTNFYLFLGTPIIGGLHA